MKASYQSLLSYFRSSHVKWAARTSPKKVATTAARHVRGKNRHPVCGLLGSKQEVTHTCYCRCKAHQDMVCECRPQRMLLCYWRSDCMLKLRKHELYSVHKTDMTCIPCARQTPRATMLFQLHSILSASRIVKSDSRNEKDNQRHSTIHTSQSVNVWRKRKLSKYIPYMKGCTGRVLRHWAKDKLILMWEHYKLNSWGNRYSSFRWRVLASNSMLISSTEKFNKIQT